MVNPYDIERLEVLIEKFKRLNLVLTPMAAVFITMAVSAIVGGLSAPILMLWFLIFCVIIDPFLFTFLQGVAVYMIAMTPTEMEEEEEEDDGPVETTFRILKTSEGFIGKYKDVDYVEWMVLIDDEGRERHATFFGIADLTRDVALEEGCFVLPPGIIYKLKPL